MLKQDTIQALARFGLVGGAVTLVNFGLLSCFYSVLGWGPRTSFWAAYFPGALLHFCLTKWWTFRSASGDVRRQLIGYFAVAGIAVAVQFGAYHFALRWVTHRPQAAYIIAAGAQMGLSFLLMRQKVFNSPRATESKPAPVNSI
jgi:putative flippase GtrA